MPIPIDLYNEIKNDPAQMQYGEFTLPRVAIILNIINNRDGQHSVSRPIEAITREILDSAIALDDFKLLAPTDQGLIFNLLTAPVEAERGGLVEAWLLDRFALRGTAAALALLLQPKDVSRAAALGWGAITQGQLEEAHAIGTKGVR